ncbi:DUF309 domain-containing protein [Anaerolinea sp.]|uniref:DUF309 domain-containing protein n=1 Tax=Anaerolinea sp. TaxID=1872519 RepID=UPI002ACDA9DF|nr:DUF309 domain-containing protein [Anaerolinea sp.]
MNQLLHPNQPCTPQEAEEACTKAIHPSALRGIRAFNQGDYYAAHEELEIAWRAEKSALRHVYRGILQIGLAYYHILRGNYRGAVKMFAYSRYWLSSFPDVCCGVHLEKLRQDAQKAESLLLKLGEENLSQFPKEFFKPIEMETC